MIWAYLFAQRPATWKYVLTLPKETGLRTVVNSRGMVSALGLALLATVSVAGCTAHPPGNVAGQPISQAASATAATEAASPPAAAPGAATGQAGIQNLVVTSAERSELTAAFVAYKGVPLSEVAGGEPVPGSVYYAYDPATGTFWAAANFAEVNGLSLKAMETYQNGGDIGMFRKAGAGSWQVQTAASSLDCLAPHFFPKAVLIAWSLPTAPRCID
jgi:hypothetical protein